MNMVTIKYAWDAGGIEGYQCYAKAYVDGQCLVMCGRATFQQAREAVLEQLRLQRPEVPADEEVEL